MVEKGKSGRGDERTLRSWGSSDRLNVHFLYLYNADVPFFSELYIIFQKKISFLLKKYLPFKKKCVIGCL